MDKQRQNRQTYLDILRMIAALLVIFNHTGGYRLYLEQAADGSVLSWFRVALSVFTKVNVPLFFMISGALLLTREESYRTILCKRIPRIAIPLIVFSVLYAVMTWDELSFINLVRELLLGRIQVTYWFLYAYLDFLLALPLLRKIAKHLTFSDVVVLFAVRMIFVSILPVYRYWAELHYIDPLKLSGYISADFSVTDILFYPLIGHYLANILRPEKLEKKELAGCFLTLLGGIAVSSYLTYHQGKYVGFTQDFLASFSYATSAALFILTRYFCTKVTPHPKTRNVLAEIANLTFGVYLIVPFLQELFYDVCQNGMNTMLYSFLWCLCSMAVASAITFALKKVPMIRNLV